MKNSLLALLFALATPGFSAESTPPMPTPAPVPVPKFELKGLPMGLTLADYLPRKNIQLVPKGVNLEIQVTIVGYTLADRPADFTLAFVAADVATWTKFFTGQVAGPIAINTPTQQAAAKNFTLENVAATFKASDFAVIAKALTLKYGAPKVKSETFTLPSGEELPNESNQWIVNDVYVTLKHYGEKSTIGSFSVWTKLGLELRAKAVKAAAEHAIKDV